MAANVADRDERVARLVLGVDARATPVELRSAFNAAAKRVHPDRPGGSAQAFREVLEAYRGLQALAQSPQPVPFPTAPKAATAALVISPLVALRGGRVVHCGADGRRLRLTLPAGLRAGEAVRAAEATLRIEIRGAAGLFVHGDDIWMTTPIEPWLFARGGRAQIDTRLGARDVFVNRKAGEGRLLRLAGAGLPARGGHAAGDLVLRLVPKAAPANSAAGVLRRRFAAAWAA